MVIPWIIKASGGEGFFGLLSAKCSELSVSKMKRTIELCLLVVLGCLNIIPSARCEGTCE